MVHFRGFIFKGKRTARKAIEAMEDNYPDFLWIDDVAVLSRNKRGYLSVHSTWAQDDDNVKGNVGWGALTGGLLGALLGPGGAIFGALSGGTLGGLIGTGIDVDISDPNLDEFANRLDNDTSALVLVAAEPVIEEFVTALGVVDAEVVDTELDEADVKAIRKAMDV